MQLYDLFNPHGMPAPESVRALMPINCHAPW
jgi:hypothetical protein